jgi:glutathione S-transferase
VDADASLTAIALRYGITPMTQMTLYYLPGSCSLAVHIVLRWVGQSFDLVRLTREDFKRPSYLALNPRGLAPVLVHDGWALTQAAAILQYISDLHPDHGLDGGRNVNDRAEVRRWLCFLNSDVHPAFRPFYGSTAYLAAPTLIETSKNAAREALMAMFEQIDRHLEGRDWLARERSIADPYLYTMLRWAQANAIDLSGQSELARFFRRIEADPEVRDTLSIEALI